MDYEFLGILAVAIVVFVGVAVVTSRQPGRRIRRCLARADVDIGGDHEAPRGHLAEAARLVEDISDESEQRELRYEIARRLGSIALLDDDYEEALGHLEQAVAFWDGQPAPNDPRSLEPFGNLAVTRLELHHDGEADHLFQRVLSYVPNDYPVEQLVTADHLHRIAMACIARNLYRWPMRLLDRSLEFLDPGDDTRPLPSLRLEVLRGLAQCAFITGLYDRCETALDELEASQDPAAVRTAAHLRGHLNLLTCRWDEAEDCFMRRAGVTEPDGATANPGDLADLRRAQGRLVEALELAAESLAARIAELGGDHRHVAFEMLRYGMILLQYGRLREADEQLRRGIEIARAQRRRGNPLLGTLLSINGILKLECGLPAEAAESLEESLAIGRGVYGAAHVFLEEGTMVLADAKCATGDLPRAEELLHEAVAMSESREMAVPCEVIDRSCLAVRIALAAGDLENAEQWSAQGLETARAHFDPSHYLYGELHHERGRLRHQQGRLADAEACYRESLTFHESSRLPEHPAIGRVLSDYARLLEEMGRREEAAPMRERADAILESARSALTEET